MALNLKYAVAAKNARLDALKTYIGGGAIIRVYDGAQPASPDTAVSTQVLLAELTGATPFAPAASGGVLTASAIANDASANATGGATWFRLFQSNGTTPVMDGTVGTSGADLNLATTAIAAGTAVSVTSFVLTSGN